MKRLLFESLRLFEATRIAKMFKAGKLNSILARDPAAIKYIDHRSRLGSQLYDMGLDMSRIGEFGSGVNPESVARMKQFKENCYVWKTSTK